jgi:hypothetical protein
MKRSLLALSAVACMSMAAMAIDHGTVVIDRAVVTWRRVTTWLQELGAWLVSKLPRRHAWWASWYRVPPAAEKAIRRAADWLRPRVSTRWKLVPST